MKKTLVIAGFDPTGNAGVLRDAQMLHQLGVQVSSVITAHTLQTKTRFYSLNAVGPPVFKNTLKSLLPFSQFDSIKIGMMGNEKLVKILVDFFKKEKNLPPIILDPVYRSTTGGELLNKEGVKLLFDKLIPLSSLWTPNSIEASFFSGIAIKNHSDILHAAQTLYEKTKVPVLIKGGHLKGSLADLFFDGHATWFKKKRISKKLRGTGCALASLIAGNLALGKNLKNSIKAAEKNFLRHVC